MPETPLTEAECKALVADWYHKLDVHVPPEELLPLLADEGLEMTFPEGTFQGHEGGRKWYEGALNKFFDEVHTLKETNVEIAGDRADCHIVVNWQARSWDPPDAKSKWYGFDCLQTWVLQRSPESGRAVILTYVVDKLIPMEGSVGV